MKQIPLSNIHVDELLCRTVQADCKGLHLQVGQSPLTRACNGEALSELSEFEAFTALDLLQMVYSILTDQQIVQLERDKKLNFSYSVARIAEFNVNVILFKGRVQAEFHVMPSAKQPAV